MTKRDLKVRRLVRMSAAFAAAAITASITHSARAATLYWDPGLTNSSSGGGTGTWNSNSTANWWNGAADVKWTDTSALGTDTAVFNDTAGTVTVSGSPSALGLQFLSTGYTLSAATTQTLTLGSGGINASTLTSGTTTIGAKVTLSLQGAQSWTLGTGAILTTTSTGTITRNVGSTVDFSTSGAFEGTNLLSKVGTTVDGWATIGGTDWAISNGTKIAAIGSYTSDTWASSNNTTVTTNDSPTSGSTTNSLRFNSSTVGYTVTLAGTNTITSGGILVTSAVGSNLSTITGGTLEGASGKDLVVIQNNTNGGLTIGSAIANNGSATALTKSGLGLLTLTGTNTYTGNTDINAGTLTIGSSGTLGSGTYSKLINNSGEFVYNSSSNQTLSGIVSGAGTLTMSGSGTLTLSVANTYTGTTTVAGGRLVVTGSTASGSAVGVSAGSIGGTGTINGAVTLSGTGGIDLADGSIGTLALGSTLGITGAAGANNLTFDLGNATSTTDKITVVGTPTVTNAGAAVINFNQLGQSSGHRVNAGTYTLIQGTTAMSATGYALATTAAFGSTFSLAASADNLQVTTTQAAVGPAAAFWGGTPAGTWTTAGNWYTSISGGAGTVPGYRSNVTFVTTTPGVTQGSTTLGADFDINSLTFNTTATGMTIAGTKMLTIEATNANSNILGNGITSNNTSGTNTISANIGLASSQTWTVAGGGTLAVSGIISDFGVGNSLTVAGAGQLTLSGANTYTGNTTISSGTLAIGGAGTLGSGTYAGSIDDAGTLLFSSSANQTLSGPISDVGFLTMSGSGTLTLSGSNTYGGDTTINSGTLIFTGPANANYANYTGNTNVNGGHLTFVDMAPNLSPTITVVSGATIEFSVSTTPNAGDEATPALSSNVALGGPMITGDGLFLKTGPGVLALDGPGGGLTTTFAMTGGTIEIAQGTLRNMNYGGNGGGTWSGNLSSLQIDPGATFDMGSPSSSPTVYIDALNGSGIFTNHFPGTAPGTPDEYAGADGVASLSLGNNNGNGSFAGILQDNDGVNNLAGLAVLKEGTGTQTLDGTSGGITYSGGTEVDGGTLILKNTVTGSGTFNITNAATLQFCVTTGTLTISPGSTQIYSGGVDTGTITDNGSAGNLIKSGSGTLVLGAPVAYDAFFSLVSGPEYISLSGLIDVQGGTLKTVSSGNPVWAGNTAALQVESGATFDMGDADVTVDYLAGGGTIDKSSAGTHTLTIGINNNMSGTLMGGLATFSGNITSSGGGVLNLFAVGTGTQILSGNNTYTGVTKISGVLETDPVTNLPVFVGGVLSTGTAGILANGGMASSIGKSSNVASNLVLDGGTLQYAYAGSAQTTDRLFTLTSNGGTLDASGTSPITFSNTGAIVYQNPNFSTELLTLTGTGTGVLYPLITDNVGKLASVTVTGTGMWELPAANTYTGVTTISAGFLSDGMTLGNPVLSTGPSGILANGGVASSIGASTNIASNLIIDGGTLQYANTGSVNQSTDRLFTVTANGATLDASGTNSSITFAGNGVGAANAITFSAPSPSANSLTLTGSGVGVLDPIINDDDTTPGDGSGPTSVFKTGSGTWTLNAPNTYTGGTTISAGTLILGNTAALGDPTSPLTITGGTLDLHGFSPTVNGLSDAIYDPVAMAYGSSSSAGIITSANGPATLNIVTNSSTSNGASYSGAISDTISNPITVVVSGGGIQTFTGVNTYSGGTFVNSGTLVGSTGSFGSGNLTVAGGAEAESTGSIAPTAVVTINSDPVAGPGIVFFNDANPVIASLMGSGSVTLNANLLPSQGITTLTISGGGNFSGVITDANDQNGNGLGAIKLTGGTLILSGSNGYSGGTTITGGTLLAKSPSSTGTGPVLVSGGRLGGTGVILNDPGSPVTITTGGTISPGPDAVNTTVGTLTTGDMTWQNGTYIFKTTSTTALSSTVASTAASGTSQDFLVLSNNGALNIDTSDGKFTINIYDSGQLATPFIIANASTIEENGNVIDSGPIPEDFTAQNITGDFIVEDNGVTNSNYIVTVVADGSDPSENFGGYDLQISVGTPVPEPGSLGLLGLASLGLLRRRTGRRSGRG